MAQSAPAPRSITVEVQFFARYLDLMGTQRLALDLPVGATVGVALERVREAPGGDRLPASLLVAVNLLQADPDAGLRDGDELAILPPLAGG